jgi:hypothetical protein
MAIQSIRTPIEERDVAGNHLLVPARQVPFRKMDGVGKFNNLSQKIRPRAKAFDDAGHLLSSRARAPKIVCCSYFAGSLGVFGDPDLCRRFCVKFGGPGFLVHVHDCELYFLRNFRTAEHWIIGANCVPLKGAIDWNSCQHYGHSQQGLTRAVPRQQYKQERH